MKIHPQFISQKGVPAFVVLPYKEYEALLEAVEDVEDIESIKKSEKDSSERFPLDIIEKIASGESTIKVFREYRQMSQIELARRVGVSRQYVSQLEAGDRLGTAKLLKKIAAVLSVDLDDIA